MIVRGQLAEGVQSGMAALDRRPPQNESSRHAEIGQLLGHALLHLGREEEAEELFRRQLRVYEAESRVHVRRMSSLDTGILQLALQRPGRAAIAFNLVADDDDAPPALRLQALCGLASCLRELGKYERAERALACAQNLFGEQAGGATQHLIDAISLETAVLRDIRGFDEGGDDALRSTDADAVPSSVRLLALAQDLADLPVAVQRLKFLAALADNQASGADYSGRIFERLATMRADRLSGLERQCRVEAMLAFVARGDARSAQDCLSTLAPDEESVRRHRHALELKYGLSRIFALHGRHADALRLYKEHVTQSLGRLHTELSHLPYSRCIEKQAGLGTNNDPMKLQLPLRYRRAYQYILEHLNEQALSVREVATHIDVSERSLQAAFRAHLGMTPAELIRRRRVEMIHKELRESSDRHGVLDVAQRWGVTKRSTFSQNYRKVFHETPTALLRQGTVGVPHAALAEIPA